jgi:hypothetical protein
MRPRLRQGDDKTLDFAGEDGSASQPALDALLGTSDPNLLTWRLGQLPGLNSDPSR